MAVRRGYLPLRPSSRRPIPVSQHAARPARVERSAPPGCYPVVCCMSGSAWASNEATPIRRNSDISDGSSSSLSAPTHDQPVSSLSEAMALDAAVQHWSRSQSHDAGVVQGGYAALGIEGTSAMAQQADAARRWQQQQQYQQQQQQQQYHQQRYFQQQQGYQQQQQQRPPRPRPHHLHHHLQPQPHSQQSHLLAHSPADIYLQQTALLSRMHSGPAVASTITHPEPSDTTALLPATALGYPAAMSHEQGIPSLFFSFDSSAGTNTPHPSSLPLRDARRASAPTSLDPGQQLGSTLFSAAPSASTASETPPWDPSTTPLQPSSPSSSVLLPSQADSTTFYPSQASSHSLPVLLSSLPATGSVSLNARLASPTTSSPYSPFGKASNRSQSATKASTPSSPPTSFVFHADGHNGIREGEASGTFRARELDSKESAPACDFCRKRKVKVGVLCLRA